MPITKVKSDYFITLQEAKDHLRVDTINEDSYIMNLIKSAVEHSENFINKDIAATTSTLVLKDFIGGTIEIDEGNFISITSVKDALNNSLTYSDLCIYDSSFKFLLDASLPEQDITIIFKTGYTNATLPYPLRQYIMIKIADFYDIERSSYNFNNLVRQNLENTILEYYQAKKVKYVNYNRE
jgi:hypothetical protein